MMRLREYQQRSARLCDWLPWGMLIEDGIMLNKDGAYMATVAFRGPDLASSTAAILMALRAQLNHAHKGLGSSWCLHVEARREPSPPLPAPRRLPRPRLAPHRRRTPTRFRARRPIFREPLFCDLHLPAPGGRRPQNSPPSWSRTPLPARARRAPTGRPWCISRRPSARSSTSTGRPCRWLACSGAMSCSPICMAPSRRGGTPSRRRGFQPIWTACSPTTT